MSDASVWYYYKLYMGEHEDALDFMISDGIDEAVRLFGAEGWFFLRYVDEGGLHLRLRFRLPEAQAETLDRRLYETLDRALTHVPLCPPSPYRPLLTFRNLDMPRPEATPVQCVRDVYEPEIDVYGGAIGMEIAEALFCDSSRIARQILIDENRNVLNRKDMVVPLMIEAVQAFVPRQKMNGFLDWYAAFWIAGSLDAGTLKTAFADKAYDLIDEGAEIIRRLSGAAEAHVVAWKEAVRRAHQRYKKSCPVYSPSFSDTLCFHVVHLMNNRLGITPYEEAYLAVMIDKALESGHVYESA